jgi:hypothetical protein
MDMIRYSQNSVKGDGNQGETPPTQLDMLVIAPLHDLPTMASSKMAFQIFELSSL